MTRKMLVPAEPNPVCYCSCHLAFTQLSVHLSTTLALQLIKFLTTLYVPRQEMYILSTANFVFLMM